MNTPAGLDPAVVAEARKLIAAGADQQAVMVFLRDRGFTRIPSVFYLRHLYGMNHAEAKTAIHYSLAWADCRETTEEFWDNAEKALDELAAAGEIEMTKKEREEP